MTPDEIAPLVHELRRSFRAGRSRSFEWRQRQLDGLQRFIEERKDDLTAALVEDLGKPPLEAFGAELAFTLGEIEAARRKLRDWMKPEPVHTPLVTQPGSSWIQKEPLGVVLIIAPWNYPFQLAISPLLGAVAAGNCAIVKPSEVSAATSAAIARWLPQYVDPDCIRVVEGGVPETTALLAEKFDHIFYTGNGTVGRIVMTAAAKHLTPVTLELGGKSPCIVDRQVDLVTAAKRIVWGKFFNAGQTCVAPDYVLAHEQVHDALLGEMARVVRDFYGSDPKSSPDYARIINLRHLRRLAPFLQDGKNVTGGQVDEAQRYIAPTILRDVSPGSPVMADEIFGPILPVLKIRGIDEAVDFVNERPKPLALYIFSSNESTQQFVLERTSSGGATVNHVWLHLAVPDLPFGGVGESGMGAYHGRATFETFSHRKSVLSKSTAIDPPLLYPPYTDSKAKWIKRLL